VANRAQQCAPSESGALRSEIRKVQCFDEAGARYARAIRSRSAHPAHPAPGEPCARLGMRRPFVAGPR